MKLLQQLNTDNFYGTQRFSSQSVQTVMQVTAPSAHCSVHTHGQSVGPPVDMMAGSPVGAAVASGVLLRAAPSATNSTPATIKPSTATPAKISSMRTGMPPMVLPD